MLSLVCKIEIFFCIQYICKNIICLQLIIPFLSVYSLSAYNMSSRSDNISIYRDHIVSELRALRDDDDDMMDVFRSDEFSNIIVFAQSVASLAHLELLDYMVSDFINLNKLSLVGDYDEMFIMYGVYVDKLKLFI